MAGIVASKVRKARNNKEQDKENQESIKLKHEKCIRVCMRREYLVSSEVTVLGNLFLDIEIVCWLNRPKYEPTPQIEIGDFCSIF